MKFLTLDRIQRLHLSQIQKYGGEFGVRDLGLLDSAAAMPKATFGGDFLHADIFEMAAAYLYHIVQNHPFVDGNKRTGASAAIIFLKMNNVSFKLDEKELEVLVLNVAQGLVHKPEIAAFFRRNVTPD